MDTDDVLQWKTNTVLLLTDIAIMIADIMYLGYEWSIGKTMQRTRRMYQHLFANQAHEQISTAASNLCDLDALNAIEVNLNNLRQSSACLQALRHTFDRNLKCKLFPCDRDKDDGVETKHKIIRFFKSFSSLFKQKQTEMFLQISTEQNKLKRIDDKLNESQTIIECHLKYLQNIQHQLSCATTTTHDIITQMMHESDAQLSILQRKQQAIEQYIDEYDSAPLCALAQTTSIMDAQNTSQQLYQHICDALHTTLMHNRRLPSPSLPELAQSHDINTYHYAPPPPPPPPREDVDDEMKVESSDGLMPTLDSILFVTQDTVTFPNGLYVSHINHQPAAASVTKSECNIFQLCPAQPRKLFTKTNKWIIQYCGLCMHRNLRLPHSVTQRIQSGISYIQYCGLCMHRNLRLPHSVTQRIQSGISYNDDHIDSGDNVVMFKAGGYSEAKNKVMAYCSAIILPSTAKCVNQATARGYNWKLPSLPVRCYGNQLVFNSKHGLLSIGGNTSNACHLLRFDDQAMTTYDQQQQQQQRGESLPESRHGPSANCNSYEWQWQSLPCMTNKRAFSACLSFGSHRSKLAVIGGVSDGCALDTVEIFDLNAMQWSQDVCGAARLNFARYESGCFYDTLNEYLVVGGGCGSTDTRTLNSCEYFDAHKQKWLLLPFTNFDHYNYPIIWSQTCHRDQHRLYIASLYANGIECIDIRANDKKW
eukprot:CAMPEP_0202729772 /NCGR_PEP_ID=MMETSP1385-20130828/186304_1 /ASSEMBLY_ACC=CAM_ASM_000861 /TAXON_ID=933848 /ORGANISM="Elphidium margaritaceum" /LENGTH=704 /DNA_ID=CAMNT_0049396043 /DNA_START=44 /DNA_END=2155 /DNA_ORIENTATION=+